MNQKDLQNILESTIKKSFSNVQIFEEGIDLNTQLEFEKLTKAFLKNNAKDRDIKTLKNGLFNAKTTEEERKNILIELSFSDDVQAFRLLEKFNTQCVDDFKKWATLALQKSRAHIEHSLSNEDKVYISSGLGGSGNKLRFFFVMSSKNDAEFNKLQKEILKKEIEFSVKNRAGTIEKIIFQGYFVTVLCLIPITQSLDKIFLDILKECNSLGDFLSDRVIATNTEEFDNEIIKGILNDDPDVLKNFNQFPQSSLDFDEFDDDDDDDYFEGNDFLDDDDFDEFDDDDFDEFDDDDFLPF